MAPKQEKLEDNVTKLLKVKIENEEVKTPADDDSPPEEAPPQSTSSASKPVSVPVSGGHLTAVLEKKIHGGRQPAASSGAPPTGGHLSATANQPLTGTPEGEPEATTIGARLLMWEFNPEIVKEMKAKAYDRKPTIDAKKRAEANESAPEVMLNFPETRASVKVADKEADTVTLIELAEDRLMEMLLTYKCAHEGKEGAKDVFNMIITPDNLLLATLHDVSKF